MKLITTSEAAERLGVHQTRVQVLIRTGRLPATKYGKAYLINEKDLALVAVRKIGRPKKAAKKTRKAKVPTPPVDQAPAINATAMEKRNEGDEGDSRENVL